jgi:flagellar biosynthesis protein FliQ
MPLLTHAVKEGLLLLFLVAAPPLLAVLAVGLVSAVVQTATQVKDAAVSSVPKLAAALVALALAGPFIGGQLVRFARALLLVIPAIGRS